MIPRIHGANLREAVAPLVLVLALTACDDTPTQQVEGPGSLSVYLTDDPGVDRVWVEVLDVLLVNDEEAPLSIQDEPTELIEISELDDEAVALVEGMSVDTATFRQVRFVIGDAILLTTDGAAYVKGDPTFPDDVDPPQETSTLHCPSCSQSGLKVRLSEDVVVTGGDNGLLLDFRVGESFGRQAGRSGKWVMRPVITGETVDPDDMDTSGFSGAVTGTVAIDTMQNGDPLFQIPDCPTGTARDLTDFIPMAKANSATDDDGNPLEFSGQTAADGSFSITVDAEDTYTLGHRAEQVFGSDTLAFQARVDPDEAVLTAESDTVSGVSYTLETAECRSGGSGSGA